MKKTILISVITLFINNLNYSQCNNEEPKMLILGDSWAYFSWTYDSYKENLERFGLSDKTAYSTSNLSVNGKKASNFFTDSARVQELTSALNDNPSIEYIHFSLGGNDILGSYKVSNTTNQNQQDYATLMGHIKSGIELIHTINPNLKILLSGYDYPNFEETILNFPLPSQHPFYSRWNTMGQPTAAQLNVQLTNVSNLFTDSAAAWNNVVFVNNLGLMQNTYGQPTPLTVAPGGTYTAGSLTVPSGLPNYPSPTSSLNSIGIIQDSFHLSDEGFDYFTKRYFEEYYWEAIRNADATVFSSDPSLNGTVTATSVTSDSLSVGMESGILTFNTSSLNSAFSIENAAIFISREHLNGANLAAEELNLEIKAGFFGANLQLELDDYASSPDTSGVACTYGTLSENNAWLRIDIPTNFLQYIDATGTTQFRLKYANATANNYVNFHNNSSAATQAILDVNYGITSSIADNTNLLSEVYPNPFTNELTIQSNEQIETIQLFAINGQLVDSFDAVNATSFKLNTQEVEKGIYMLTIKNKNGLLTVKKVVK